MPRLYAYGVQFDTPLREKCFLRRTCRRAAGAGSGARPQAGGAVNGGAYAPFILTVDWLDWLCYYQKSYLSCDTMFAHSRFTAFRTGQSAFCKSMIAFYILIHARDKKFFTMRTLKITGLNVKHCARRYACYCH